MFCLKDLHNLIRLCNVIYDNMNNDLQRFEILSRKSQIIQLKQLCNESTKNQENYLPAWEIKRYANKWYARNNSATRLPTTIFSALENPNNIRLK